MESPFEEVSLEQMLEAREKRAFRQQQLLRDGLTLVSFSMNIAGPVKNSSLITKGFYEGCRLIEYTLSADRIKLLFREDTVSVTGCESLMLVNSDDPFRVKKTLTQLEERDRLGRLFDIDVISPTEGHISRTQVGFKDRSCLICGAPGRICASRRLHSVEELQKFTNEILTDHFRKKHALIASECAERALFYEVCVTPKPGLVDRNNSGSHTDMDFFTFIDSIVSISPYLSRCVNLGMDTASSAPAYTFDLLRREGKLAEGDMKKATNGVNTHKGAIFSLGIICGAVGRLSDEYHLCSDTGLILRTAADLVAVEISHDLTTISECGDLTAGQKQFVEFGLKGIRGEALDGFPSVKNIGLPVLRKALSSGRSPDDAGAIALLHLIAAVDDGCLISRCGRDAQLIVQNEIKDILRHNSMPDTTLIKELDDRFIKAHMSPGGCADLLAISYMLLFLEQASQA